MAARTAAPRTERTAQGLLVAHLALIAFSSVAMVTVLNGPPSPFLNILFAVTHPTNRREALTREQAVTAYTSGSARAERMEAQKGTLAPGMLADLAILSQDIFAVPPDALPATTSVLTIVGGTIVHERP